MKVDFDKYSYFLGDFSEYLVKQFELLSKIEVQILATLVQMKNPVVLKELKTQFNPDEIIEVMQGLESL